MTDGRGSAFASYLVNSGKNIYLVSETCAVVTVKQN